MYHKDVLNSCYQNERNMIKLQHLPCIPLLSFVTIPAQIQAHQFKVISSEVQSGRSGVAVSVGGSPQNNVKQT